MTKAGIIAAWKQIYGSEVSGHSLQRNGAMFYFRAGLQIQELALLGRWKSCLVLSYAEEALQETAVKVPQLQEASKCQLETATSSSSKTNTPCSSLQTPEGSHGQVEGIENQQNSQVGNLFNTPRNLWALTKRKGTKPRPAHVVT